MVDTPGGATTSKSKGAPKRSVWLTYPDPQAAGAFMATVSADGKAVQTSQPMDTADDLALFLARGRVTSPSPVSPTGAPARGGLGDTGGWG